MRGTEDWDIDDSDGELSCDTFEEVPVTEPAHVRYWGKAPTPCIPDCKLPAYHLGCCFR